MHNQAIFPSRLQGATPAREVDGHHTQTSDVLHKLPATRALHASLSTQANTHVSSSPQQQAPHGPGTTAAFFSCMAQRPVFLPFRVIIKSAGCGQRFILLLLCMLHHAHVPGLVPVNCNAPLLWRAHVDTAATCSSNPRMTICNPILHQFQHGSLSTCKHSFLTSTPPSPTVQTCWLSILFSSLATTLPPAFCHGRVPSPCTCSQPTDTPQATHSSSRKVWQETHDGSCLLAHTASCSYPRDGKTNTPKPCL